MKTTAKSDFPGLVPKAFLGVLKNGINGKKCSVCSGSVYGSLWKTDLHHICSFGQIELDTQPLWTG